MRDKLPRKIHFVGIGGIGMSGLAEFLHLEGHEITGSDLNKSENTIRLEKLGIPISYEHKAENAENAGMIVYSSAIPPNNPERKLEDIPTIKRAVMLNKVMKKRPNQIAVSGMHGKTTTSSILTHIFEQANFDPSALLGGILRSSKTNIRYGNGQYCIVEADEYDRSFLELYPTHGIITNIEEEHLDIYSSLDDIKNSFKEFASRINPPNLVICRDDENMQDILPELEGAKTYGIDTQSDYMAKDCQYYPEKSIFQLVINGQESGQITISLTGKHNILNSLACIAMGQICGLELDKIANALENFAGAGRRLEKIYQNDDFTLLDDYAHHPSEIDATLQALKKSRDNRLIVIFQPHLYSRTKSFHKDFARVLKKADKAIVTDIYPAREKPIPGINSQMITEQDRDLNYCQKENLTEYIAEIIKPGDLIITMGAGDINHIHPELIEAIKRNKS